MKNLIEEIEKIIVSLKRQYKNCFEEIDCPLFTSDEIRGKILAYKDCLNLLNQYNIITAPKQIKLSEIVEKLKECYHISSISYDKQSKSIHDGEDDIVPLIEFNEDLTFKEINLPIRDNNKWLYPLWIAGTEIIDDLKDEE